jgi:hypothetical protein
MKKLIDEAVEYAQGKGDNEPPPPDNRFPNMKAEARLRVAPDDAYQMCDVCRFYGDVSCFALDSHHPKTWVCDVWSGLDELDAPDLTEEEQAQFAAGVVSSGRLSLHVTGMITTHAGVHLLFEDRSLGRVHRFALLLEDLLDFVASDVGWGPKDVAEMVAAGRS